MQILYIKILYCFQYDMAYGKSKDLTKRTHSDKVLKYEAFKIARDRKGDGCQRGLASVVYKFFDKTSSSLNKSSGNEITNEPNYQPANKLYNELLENLKKEKFILLLEIIFGVLI